MPLTDKACKAAKPNPLPSKTPKKLADGEGLYLFVMPNGAKYWRLLYRFHGKQKTYALGVYPEVTLKEAREKKYKVRKMLAQGLDPSIERKKEKTLALKSAANTFEAVARDWYENRKHIWKQRYADEVLKRLECDIFPYIGSIPITEIDSALLIEVIRKIEKRGATDLAKRQLQKCGEIFRFAISEGKLRKDISFGMHEGLKYRKKTHFAAIEVEELPDFLKVLERNDARLYQSTRNALKLIMLTFVRTSELINARWDEIDFDRKQWIIPAERMKMGKEHIVPLSKQAIEILENQKELSSQWELVFPSNVKPQKSISNNTILGALKRLGYQGRMTGHGFRALAMSAIKQELGYRHEVVDRQLAHVPKSKIDKAYDRALFLEERTRMMQEWSDYLDSIRTKGL